MYLSRAKRVFVENEAVRHRLAIDDVERLLESGTKHQGPVVDLSAINGNIRLDNAPRKKKQLAHPVLGDPEAEKCLRWLRSTRESVRLISVVVGVTIIICERYDT